MNCDGAFKESKARDKEENAGIGVIKRNDEGKVIAGMRKRILVKTGEKAEVEAIREGIKLAKRRGYERVIVETDSEIVYREIKGGRQE